MRSTEACYINQDYVEQLGYTVPDVLTWDFIWEVSEAAAKKGADGKYVLNGGDVMIPFIYKSTDNMMIQMLRQKKRRIFHAVRRGRDFQRYDKGHSVYDCGSCPFRCIFNV